MSFQFLPLYTGDYLRDTRHLSMAEHGCYIELLMYCWDQKGPAPLDERRLLGIVNARSGDEIEAMRRVLQEFFIRTDDGWYNKRITEEVAKAEIISKKRKQASDLAVKRRSEIRAALRQPNGNQVLTKCSPSAGTPTPTPTPTTTTTTATTKPIEIASLSLVADESSATHTGNDQNTPPEPSATPEKPTSKKQPVPDCPHLKIIDLYGEVLPGLPQPSPAAWEGTRAQHLSSRWRWVLTAKRRNGERYAENTDQGLDFFKRFFEYVSHCPHLMGGARSTWTASLPWLIKAENFAKVIEGNYEDRKCAVAS